MDKPGTVHYNLYISEAIYSANVYHVIFEKVYKDMHGFTHVEETDLGVFFDFETAKNYLDEYGSNHAKEKNRNANIGRDLIRSKMGLDAMRL